jgi:hypothetical protein
VAVHVIARARVEGSGRFSLRVTPGGFGTPDAAGTAFLLDGYGRLG